MPPSETDKRLRLLNLAMNALCVLQDRYLQELREEKPTEPPLTMKLGEATPGQCPECD